MKKRVEIVLFGLSVLLTGVSCTQTPAASVSPVGVWVDKDCELLRTERFALLFENTDSMIISKLYSMDAVDTVLLGETVFDIDTVLVRTHETNRQPVDLGTVQPDGRLRIRMDGRERQLEKVEKFTVVEPYEMLKASPLEVGSCMQQWNLGTKCRCEEESISFEAGTNRHNYTFNIQPGFIYCRAARLRFDDHGGLFSQNIRLMSNAREHRCFMAEDNRAESAAPLMIDDSKFSPDQCVFANEGIYWSFLRFEGDTAVLNGCGEIYRFARPADRELTEWIAFEKY